jgi:hypothetical protein
VGLLRVLELPETSSVEVSLNDRRLLTRLDVVLAAGVARQLKEPQLAVCSDAELHFVFLQVNALACFVQ